MIALDATAMGVFARAVSRLSGTRVDVRGLAVPVSEALSLWCDLAIAFSRSEDGAELSEFELASLRRRVAERSGGRARLDGCSFGISAALAIWRVACRLSDWVSRYSVARVWRRRATVVGGALLASQLAACGTLLGGNVKGNFACSAPNGTCAPSTVIDDQALSVIQNARPMTPAGPYYQEDRQAAPVTALGGNSGGRLLAVGDGVLHRDRRMLRVVFPSFVDGKGNLHEPRVVHTVADAGGWMQVTSGEATLGEQALGRSQALNGPRPTGGAAEPTSLAGNTPVDVQNWELQADHGVAAAPRVAVSDVPKTGPQMSGPPDPRVVEEARRRGPKPGPNPLDAIKADVAARLGSLPAGAGSQSASASVQQPVAPAAGPGASPAAAPAQVEQVAPKEASVFPTKVGE